MTNLPQDNLYDSGNGQLTQLQQDIINNFQKGFPLANRPYQLIASQLSKHHIGLDEQNVFSAVADLDNAGIISRIGPVFDHKKAGASTLAAMAVSENELDKIASIVNQFGQVNHNYARQSYYNNSDFNLWFVVTASDPVALNNTLTSIELMTGLSILVLPMEASYHLDLAFSINITGDHSPTVIITRTNEIKQQPNSLNELQKQRLRKLLESGLPKLIKPYECLANAIDSTEEQVLSQIEKWQNTGLIRRFGLVVKHRKLGFKANAMVVWNINDELVDTIAAKLSQRPEVSLCYRRPRRLPNWPYNLFCMIHGTDKKLVLQQVDNICQELSLDKIEKDILFSSKAYKQKGASYLKSNPVKEINGGIHG